MELRRVKNDLLVLETTIKQKDALVKSLVQDIEIKEAERQLLREAVTLLSTAASYTREGISSSIERVVSHAEQMVLDREDYKFRIDFATKRNQVEAYPVQITSRSEGNPEDSNGGGILDIISTVLRLIIKRALDIPGPLFMDEPGKWVAEEHRKAYIQLLKEYSNDTGTQIIMTSHASEYIDAADKSFLVLLEEDGMKSKVMG